MRDCDLQYATGSVVASARRLDNCFENFQNSMGWVKFAGCSAENLSSDFADRREGGMDGFVHYLDEPPCGT